MYEQYRAIRRAPQLFEQLEIREMLSLTPIAGDWDSDGIDTIGYYDCNAGEFLIRNENTPGFAEMSVRFGPTASTLLPIAGDWDGDGDDSVGLYDPVAGTFSLKNDLLPGPADTTFRFGPKNSTMVPVAGDWDGNGTDGVGLYDAIGGDFFLNNTFVAGPADIHHRFGPKAVGWLPIAGDWDDDSVDTVGLYDFVTGTFYLENSFLPGPADITFGFGPPAAMFTPVAGDWDGVGIETVGLHDPATNISFLQNSHTGGPADIEVLVTPSLNPAPIPNSNVSAAGAQLDAIEVNTLLERAAAASASEDAIIAVVDRNGRILGVRAEQGVLDEFDDDLDGDPTTNPEDLVFAVDGAVAKARTAAFFANGDPENGPSGTATPLTSRLVRFVSQSTITEREIDSNPNSADPTVRGPGFVAPIGLGGHFPPEIAHTPPVDLFAIEHTNRDGTVHPGLDGVRGTPDDIVLDQRFNADAAFIPTGQELLPPDSYGFESGLFPDAQARGIATLPGGIPLFRDTDADGVGDTLVGGIGVFFPGENGYASHEQGFVPGTGQTEFELTNAPLVLESEWIAFAAAGGSLGADAPVGTLDGVAPVADLDIPFGRLTLVGIELEVVGPHPDGPWQIAEVGIQVSPGGDSTSGQNLPLLNPDSVPLFTKDGQIAPEGWIVLPHGSAVDNLTAADVQRIIAQGIAEAMQVRAAVRLPASNRTRMIFAVTDTEGNVLGLYRMQDATIFSADVAVAKARNTAYYADPFAIQDEDRVDDDIPQNGFPNLEPGIAFTNRTFRFLAEARFPDGVEGSGGGPFSILNDPGTDPATAENTGAPAPAAAHTSVLGFDAFNPGRNFRDPDNIANQNGIVFFPGSTPIYKDGVLVGGLGVSGDGVDQDDVVTSFAAEGFLPPDAVTRADEVEVRGVRLPYFKFLRNPEG